MTLYVETERQNIQSIGESRLVRCGTGYHWKRFSGGTQYWKEGRLPAKTHIQTHLCCILMFHYWLSQYPTSTGCGSRAGRVGQSSPSHTHALWGISDACQYCILPACIFKVKIAINNWPVQLLVR